jgi:hypothetical protein
MSAIDYDVNAGEGGVEGLRLHHVAVYDLDRQWPEAGAARFARYAGANVRCPGAIKNVDDSAANETTGPGDENLWPTQRHNS